MLESRSSSRIKVPQVSLTKSPFWWGARVGLNAREEARDVARRPSAVESMSRLRRIHARLRRSP
eukprot:4649202-Lingulodinium_polyedra.AAC.1